MIMFQAIPAFRDARNMAGWQPPQAVMRLVHFFEPFRALAKHADVARGVHKIAKRLDRLPHRHVDNNEGIVVVNDVGRVAGFRLQPPDESGRCIRQGVDGIELRHKTGDPRIINRAIKRPMLICARWNDMAV